MLTGRPLFNFQLKAWVATHSCLGSSISAKMNNFYTKSTGPLQLKLFLRPDKSKLPSDRRGAVYKIKCYDCQATYIGETGRNLNVRLTEHKRATRNGDINNDIAEHHLKTNHRIDWDSAECLTYSTDYYQRITLESWFTNLEQTPLNRCQQLPAPYKRLIAGNNKTDKQ